MNRREGLPEYLRDLRDSSPDVPGSVDAAVMAAYREQNSGAVVRRNWLRPVVYATVAAMLIVAVAALVVMSRKRGTTAVARVDQRPREVLQASPKTMTPAVVDHQVAASKPVRHDKTSHSQRREASVPAARAASSRSASQHSGAGMVGDPRTAGFESLLYCDPLSCAGPMQVIRIQVPVSVMERLPAARPSNGLVQADVVVGSDGVARAIRVVR